MFSIRLNESHRRGEQTKRKWAFMQVVVRWSSCLTFLRSRGTRLAILHAYILQVVMLDRKVDCMFGMASCYLWVRIAQAWFPGCESWRVWVVWRHGYWRGTCCEVRAMLKVCYRLMFRDKLLSMRTCKVTPLESRRRDPSIKQVGRDVHDECEQIVCAIVKRIVSSSTNVQQASSEMAQVLFMEHRSCPFEMARTSPRLVRDTRRFLFILHSKNFTCLCK